MINPSVCLFIVVERSNGQEGLEECFHGPFVSLEKAEAYKSLMEKRNPSCVFSVDDVLQPEYEGEGV